MRVFIFLLMLDVVYSYGLGPPYYVCESMIPGHDGSGQTKEAPYEVVFSKNQYTADESIQVTLRGKNGNTFRGFLIQPRKNVNEFTTYGEILSSSLPAGTRDPCNSSYGEISSLSHSSKTDKTEVIFNWKAPSSDVGNIVFVYSVVKTKAEYWVKLESSPLTFQSTSTNPPTDTPTDGPTDTPTDGPTDTPTDGPTDTPTDEPLTDGPTSQINRDADCEVSKNCYPSSAECSNNCDYLVSWKTYGSDEVEFSLARKTPSTNYWIAVGFSDDPKMGNDSVVACIAYDGVIDAVVSYNLPAYYSNQDFTTSNFGVTLVDQSLSDGIMRCTFRRKKSFTIADNAFGRRRRAVDDETGFFDLDNEWFLLVAHGSASNGIKDKHSEYPRTSTTKIDFLGSYSGESTEAPVDDTGVIKRDKECGKTVGCYHDCDDQSCGFLLKWKDEQDDVALSISCKRGNNQYCAIGMSSDDKMGDDSVFECLVDNGEVKVHVSYNKGRSNNRLDTPEFGLSAITTSHKDGVLTCNFKRKKTYALASAARMKRSTVPSAGTYFDMNEDWNLLYAFGTATGGFLNKHQTKPVVSSERVDFQKNMEVGGSAAKDLYVKLHGLFMTIAWMMCASIGICVARFYKNVWPEGMEWCGQKRWFVMHRALMMATFGLTTAAFILIFLHVGKYSEIVGSNFEKSHPILGIIVMAFALINPTVALFRPHPGAPKRVWFNVFHGTVGGIAHILAIINMFTGTMLSATVSSKEAHIVLWVFVGWINVAFLIIGLYDCKGRKGSKGEAYEMKAEGSTSVSDPPKVSTFKVAMLVIHMLVVVGLCAALCVMIAT